MSALKSTLSGWCVVAPLAAGVLAATPPTATEILRRSERSRSPRGDYAVDFTITVRDDRQAAPVRATSYTMLVSGRDRALVLMLSPSRRFGGSLLIDSGDYWLLLPRAEKPLQLAREQVIRGDVASGDIARSNLEAEYQAALEGRYELDGEPCFRLELKGSRENARYTRIVAWVSTSLLETRKLELYGRSGALVRTARYSGFHRTPVGVLPARIDLAGGVDAHETSTIAFSNVRALASSPVAFTPEGLCAFQKTAERLQEPGRAPPLLEAIVAALAGDRP